MYHVTLGTLAVDGWVGRREGGACWKFPVASVFSEVEISLSSRVMGGGVGLWGGEEVVEGEEGVDAF